MAHNMNTTHSWSPARLYLFHGQYGPQPCCQRGCRGGLYHRFEKQRLGIAFKCEDGTEVTWPLLINEIFKQIGYTNEAGRQRMLKLAKPLVINDNDWVVGEKRTCFQLFES